MKDFSYVFTWWLAFFCIGIIFLPLTTRIFSKFYDKGYIFSKTIGLALISYTVYILSSFHLLAFSTIGSYCVICAYILTNLFLLKKHNPFKKRFSIPRLFIVEELLFFAGIIFWAFIRGHEPSIHNLEKFMDFGFINASLRTNYMPPKDM